MIRAFTANREQVVLRADIEQLTDLLDALIARRAAMKTDRDRRRARAEWVDRGEYPPIDVAPEPVVERPARTPRVAVVPIDLPPPVEVESPAVAMRVLAPDVPPAPRAWSRLGPEGNDKIRALHGKGWSDGAIGKELGVSAVTVCKRRNAMGLASNFRAPVTGGVEARP